MIRRKTLAELNLTDRFLFDQVMEDTETYQAFVSILLEEDVRFPSRTQTEKELRVSPDLRAARLDVIAIDESEKMYYTEMQAKNTGNLIKRSRFYQAQLDVSILEPGERNFNNLNSTCMVLVAPFDIFGKGLYRYTFEGVCRECPELKLDDGTLKIFINTRGTNDVDFSREFLDLMRYIENSTDKVAGSINSEKIKLIHNTVTKVKISEQMGVKYMQWWEELEEAKDEGRKEGRLEGHEAGRLEGHKAGRQEGEKFGALHKLITLVVKKLRKGKSLDVIVDELEDDIELIKEICNVAGEFAPEYDCEKIMEKFNEKSDSVFCGYGLK